MHPIGPELPISAHVACARVCRQLYVLRASHALVQATVGVGTVIIVYIGVAYTKGGGGKRSIKCTCGEVVWITIVIKNCRTLLHMYTGTCGGGVLVDLCAATGHSAMPPFLFPGKANCLQMLRATDM